MKTNLLIKATLGVLSLGYLASCKPSSATSIPLVNAPISMTASNSTATVASYKNKWSFLMPQVNAFIPPGLVDSTGASINLTSAWVVIKEVEFQTTEVHGASETDGSEVSFRGPYFVDLLSSSPLNLDTKQIPAKAFQRIKMKLNASGAVVPSGAPAQLSNNSILLVGAVAGRNFTFQLDDSSEVNIGGPKALVPAEGVGLLVELNISNVFKQINLASVVNNEVISSANKHSGANLCLSIDPNASDLYTCVRKAVEKHANFGKDKDGTHSLGPNSETVK